MKNLKLADVTIAQIVQLLQMGILTGTDISDQMRTLTLDVDESKDQLVPSEAFTKMTNENLERFAAMAEEEAQGE
jgi:hypothetical protein